MSRALKHTKKACEQIHSIKKNVLVFIKEFVWKASPAMAHVQCAHGKTVAEAGDTP
jgi:hypothetical protein